MAKHSGIAIMNGVKTDLKHVLAHCEWTTYYLDADGSFRDVIARGTADIPCDVTVSNFPRLPGASDPYRSFPETSSIRCEVVVSFFPSHEGIKDALGLDEDIELGGDGEHITVNSGETGDPLGDVRILGFVEAE